MPIQKSVALLSFAVDGFNSGFCFQELSAEYSGLVAILRLTATRRGARRRGDDAGSHETPSPLAPG